MKQVTPAATVTLSHLTTGYTSGRGRKAISTDINAALPPASLTCLLGPNGAGKSTLLKTLCGFIPPLEGTVEIDSTSIADIPPADLARLVSVVLTDKPDVQNLTVADLVASGRSPYTGFFGRLDANDRAIVGSAISALGISSLAGRAVNTLSDGERQKAMIAKALAQETPVIILDEPTAFLDYPRKVETMMLLRNLAHTAGKTVFMSTHDLELALQLADHIWLMDRALGIASGTPRALAATGAIGAYFDTPHMTFRPDTLRFAVTQAETCP